MDLIISFHETNRTVSIPLTYENTNLAATQFYDKVEPCFDSLGYNNDCIRPVKSEPRESQAVNVFFDFETDTSGETHIPYGVNFKYNNKNYWFEGPDCGLLMLKKLDSMCLHSIRLIAHNATYDYRFIFQYLNGINEISRGLIGATGYFGEMRVQVKDRYSLLFMPLKAFGKVFNLNIKKDIMPYDFYTPETISKRYNSINEH